MNQNKVIVPPISYSKVYKYIRYTLLYRGGGIYIYTHIPPPLPIQYN
jgi:hypothetical protein